MGVVRIEHIEVAAQDRIGRVVDPADAGTARDEHQFNAVVAVERVLPRLLDRPDGKRKTGGDIVVQMIQFHASALLYFTHKITHFKQISTKISVCATHCENRTTFPPPFAP
ncbi:hypothetical protein SDC9_144873 [bioreactor metagenome]|uniref:Uncharacterized protein n=1 Tax=bioreactor metagenome TaxID=1076179 RepID=A0A645E7X1_9ZZZZ